jgi:hypothetical protein
MTRQGDLWSKPELISFWKQLIHNGDFVISPDDITMLYQVKQDHYGQLESNIWEVKLEEDGWGPRSALPEPINTLYDESYASRASNGNLYFFSRRPGGVGHSRQFKGISDEFISCYGYDINIAPHEGAAGRRS